MTIPGNGTAMLAALPTLPPEQAAMARELVVARDVIDAAEDLAHELSRLSPSAYSWPTTATMEGVNKARRALTEAIYRYDVEMLSIHGERRP